MNGKANRETWRASLQIGQSQGLITEFDERATEAVQDVEDGEKTPGQARADLAKHIRKRMKALLLNPVPGQQLEGFRRSALLDWIARVRWEEIADNFIDAAVDRFIA